jgi:hypothetical protein
MSKSTKRTAVSEGIKQAQIKKLEKDFATLQRHIESLERDLTKLLGSDLPPLLQYVDTQQQQNAKTKRAKRCKMCGVCTTGIFSMLMILVSVILMSISPNGFSGACEGNQKCQFERFASLVSNFTSLVVNVLTIFALCHYWKGVIRCPRYTREYCCPDRCKDYC